MVACVGMVGAGQLARMTHQAAIDLGVDLVVLARSADEPAVKAGAKTMIGSPDDQEALERLAREVDVVTFDHELVPNPLVKALVGAGHAVRPGPEALLCAQDKLVARETFRSRGLPVPRFVSAEGPGAPAIVREFGEREGWPVVVKTRTGGYDGRGVATAEAPEDAEAAVAALGGGDRPLLVESFVDLAMEIAVVGARRPCGEWVVYPPVWTRQVNGICVELAMPAAIGPELSSAATGIAGSIAELTGVAGILAVELFVTAGGGLVVNEIAVRPHNSGHATIEGAVTSQFHNHLRAVLDWPLGSPELRAPAAAMVNLLGAADGSDPADRVPQALSVPEAALHLYGKSPSPGRKLGHVTALGPSVDDALSAARRAAAALS